MECAGIGEIEIRHALHALLKHSVFIKSPKLAAFLTYIVEESIAGRGHLLKAYKVATQALGRGSDFDPVADAIVRVEARRLRQALRMVYQEPGSPIRLQVELPLGRYEPVFRRLPPVAAGSGSADAPRDGGADERAAWHPAGADTVVAWHADADGRITLSYGRTERVGQDRAAIAGRDWIDAIHPDDRARTLRACAKARRRRTPVEIANRVLHQDGTYRRMMTFGVPLTAPDGSIRAWVGTVIDQPAPIGPSGSPARTADGPASARRVVEIYDILRQSRAAAERAQASREAEIRSLAGRLRASGLSIGERAAPAWTGEHNG